MKSFLALKFLSGKNRSFLLSSLTLMAVLGVTISVLAFVVVQSVMEGFDEVHQEKILGFSPHVALTLKSGISPLPNPLPQGEREQTLLSLLQQDPDIQQVQRLLEGEAVMQVQGGGVQGIRLRGFDPDSPPLQEGLQVLFEEGEGWKSLIQTDEQLPGILIGIELASSLGIVPSLFEKVELLYPLGDVGPTGEVEPNRRLFQVVGVFKSGYYAYDSRYAMVSFRDAKYLLGEETPEQISLFLKDPSRAKYKMLSLSSGKLSSKYNIDKIQNWTEQHQRLFSALQLQRIGMALVLALMLLLASFNILSMLMMVVFERRHEIAILRALGLTRKQIRQIFYRAALWIGGIGGGMGILIGLITCWILSTAQVELPSSYYLDSLPIKLNLWVLVAAILLAPLLCLVATYFPARESGRVSIIQALRYE